MNQLEGKTTVREEDAVAFIETARRLEEEIGRVIVGQRQVVRDVVIALLSGGHVLLEGVPGLGKTLLVRTLGEALTLSFSRIQFTPDLMPADIVGTNVLTEDEQGRRSLQFQQGPILANLVLADEINRATPKTQSALLEAMQERTVSVGNTTRKLPSPFFVLATQNPVEMEGTYTLPEAQLDRFFFKVLVPFPDREDLGEILRRTVRYEPNHAAPVANSSSLEDMIQLAREVPTASYVQDHAVALILATHPEREESPSSVQAVRAVRCKPQRTPGAGHRRSGARPCWRDGITYLWTTCIPWHIPPCVTGLFVISKPKLKVCRLIGLSSRCWRRLTPGRFEAAEIVRPEMNFRSSG